jgi:ATP-binding cassette subfamily B protein/ATP-binding cassette subfamily C protein LapB
MSGLTFDQAANALFIAFSLERNPDEKKLTPGSIENALLGSGLTARHVNLINHIPPAEEAQAGILLTLPGEQWLPVLGAGYEAFVLAADGSRLRPLEVSDLANVDHGWVFHENLASVSRILPFLRQHKARLIEILGSSLIINFFGLLLPLFSSFVYDKVLGNGITATLWGLVIGLAIVMVIDFCLKVIRTILAERFSIASETDIDHGMFHNLLEARANTLPGVGDLLEKYKQVVSYRDFLSSTYLLSLADLPFLGLFLVVIALVSGPLVLVPIVCGAAMMAVSAFFTLPVLGYDRQARQASAQRLGLMTDVLAGREAIVGSVLGNELARRWRQASVTSTTASSLARYWRGLGMTLVGSISYASYIAVMVGGVYMIENRSLTSGGLLAASMLTSRAMANVASVITLVIRYREFRIALRELDLVLPKTQATHLLPSHARMHGSVRFDKVSCRLVQNAQPVLSQINFVITPGEMVGIAGAPGAGKTTLLRLVTGILQPSEGQVLIDDTPLDKLSPDDLSWNIGYKPQDCCLLDGTIEDNVRAGRPQMTPAVKQDILAASGLGRSFQESGLNWATPIGPRGVNLSGGQRQLVALARALLFDPALLLLDEPTNGLDSALEAHLAEQLTLRKGKSTILVSTHSRNTLMACDRIIVVGQSRLQADGPRDKIMRG